MVPRIWLLTDARARAHAGMMFTEERKKGAIRDGKGISHH